MALKRMDNVGILVDDGGLAHAFEPWSQEKTADYVTLQQIYSGS
jgi:hypothetical protein